MINTNVKALVAELGLVGLLAGCAAPEVKRLTVYEREFCSRQREAQLSNCDERVGPSAVAWCERKHSTEIAGINSERRMAENACEGNLRIYGDDPKSCLYEAAGKAVEETRKVEDERAGCLGRAEGYAAACKDDAEIAYQKCLVE
ncbi:hypothetical protein HZC30_04345 [Candidatus Woesearchaeota archaeon]|nr:hypothetical protein [Candidatus Woesearchaeota archaeon]